MKCLFSKDNQFNYTKARLNGYEWKTNFLIGKLMNPESGISWKGKI